MKAYSLFSSLCVTCVLQSCLFVGSASLQDNHETEEQLSGKLLEYYTDGKKLVESLSAVDDNDTDINIDSKRTREEDQEDDRKRNQEERDTPKIFSNITEQGPRSLQSDPPLQISRQRSGKQICQGNCRGNDGICDWGLSCVFAMAGKMVAGCSGVSPRNSGYCYIPRPQTLVLYGDPHTNNFYKNDDGSSSYPFQECQGHCRNDDDCTGNLLCFQRSRYAAVPNCKGKGAKGKNYCYKPVQVPKNLGCGLTEKKLDIIMEMDRYPQDITLTVTNQDSGEVLLQKNEYSTGNGKEAESLCIPESPANDINVRIDDKYGDGICCKWGRGKITTMLNGQPILEDRTFRSYCEVEFNSAVVITPSPTPTPATSKPTLAPLKPVTYDPGQLSKLEAGLLLSTGLRAKVIAYSGQQVTTKTGSKSSQRFHSKPDGAAVFRRADGSYAYVSNAELDGNRGGVGAIYFDPDGQVTGYQWLLGGTTWNCGGGKTPWNTWLTCEEDDGGGIYEVKPFGGYQSRRETLISRMSQIGNFESVTYDGRDPKKPIFFVTSDSSDGPLVRFTPDAYELSVANTNGIWDNVLHMNRGGSAEVHYLVLNSNGSLNWTSDRNSAKSRVNGIYPYAEGIDFHEGYLYFVTKARKELFILDLDKGTWVRSSTRKGKFNDQPDQVTRIVGDDTLYFCEDGGSNCGIHGSEGNGNYYTILEGSTIGGETTGLDFSPDKKHMYVAFQHAGRIYDITREDGYPFGGAQKMDLLAHKVSNIFDLE